MEEGRRWVYRPLRRSDLDGYFQTVLLGIGRLERATGLDQNAETTIRSLSRRSVWTIFRLAQLVGRPFVDIFVASDGRQVAGTGSILWLPTTAYIAGMSTRPESRGQGIASRILSLQKAQAVRRHRTWLGLDVESENETAIRVYRKAGYREVAKFTWHNRTGLPPTSAPAARLRAASKNEEIELAAAVNANRTADFRGAFPSGAKMLNHNELLVQGMRVPHRTWIRKTADGSPIGLRTIFSPRSRIGAYFPIFPSPGATPEDFAGLFDAGTEWLRPHEPKLCIAVTLEPPGPSGPALARLGFAPQVSTTTMVRESAG